MAARKEAELAGLAALRERVEAGGLEGCYLLLGNDRREVDAALAFLEERAVPPELAALNAQRLRGSEHSVDDVIAAASVLPMLGDRRLVLVREPETLDGDLEQLGRWAADPAPTSTLVLAPASFDRRLRWTQSLLATCRVVVCEAPGRADLDAWVKRTLSGRGITVRPDALALLADLVESDTLLLGNELEKLALYCQAKKVVEKDDVAALLGRTRALEIWDLTNALEDGRQDIAVQALRRLLEQGAAVPLLVGMLDWCVGRLLASEEPKGPPGRRRSLEARRRALRGRGEEVYAHLRAADRLFRTTGGDAPAALERAVLAACR